MIYTYVLYFIYYLKILINWYF